MTHPPMAASDRDMLQRFLIEGSGVHGVLVHLNDTWAEVRSRADYPPSLMACLGETLAATALMTGHAKVDGRLTVQLRGTGALRSLFAECTRDGTLRGLAQYAEPLPEPLTPRAFGEDSMMAITIENVSIGGRDGMRYQGLVGLDADSLAEAFEGYFAQSEQLPTRMVLATNDGVATGMMLQKLPQTDDGDGWQRAVAILETLGGNELLATPSHVLLHRLFHEDGVRILDTRSLRFGCSCSRERVEAMLQGLGREEALAAVRERDEQASEAHDSSHRSGHEGAQLDLMAEIACQFCGRMYRFTREEVMALFQRPPEMPAPPALQ